VTRCERQQRDIPCLLDRLGQAPLVRGANAREPPRHNLAALSHKPLQQANIAIRDCVNLLRTELANLLAAEELAAPAGSTTGPSAGTRAGSRRQDPEPDPGPEPGPDPEPCPP
jgi:hypothetical protein